MSIKKFAVLGQSSKASNNGAVILFVIPFNEFNAMSLADKRELLKSSRAGELESGLDRSVWGVNIAFCSEGVANVATTNGFAMLEPSTSGDNFVVVIQDRTSTQSTATSTVARNTPPPVAASVTADVEEDAL